jgi:hypothetical protein
VLLLELHYQSARVLHRGSQVLHHQGTLDYATTYAAQTNDTEASAYYTTKAVGIPTLERPSTTEISQVSFSDTQHGSPEVSNKLRFKQWNGKE